MIADEFTQLVFHTLAHARLQGAGDIYDPRYVAWAAPRFESRDLELLEHDVTLLARLWNGDARHDQLHRYCELHRDWAGFAASVDRPLAALGPDDVADVQLLEGLRALDGAELLHATLALIGPGFRRVFAELRGQLERADADVREWIARLADACPGLATIRVELVWALGVHGRGLESRILVGAPAAWNACTAARQAVLAAHEHAVMSAREDDYVAQEWAALIDLSARLRGVDGEVRAAHRDWLASLELRPLLDAAVARGYLSPSEARALIAEPHARAERLSAARAAASG